MAALLRIGNLGLMLREVFQNHPTIKVGWPITLPRRTNYSPSQPSLPEYWVPPPPRFVRQARLSLDLRMLEYYAGDIGDFVKAVAAPIESMARDLRKWGEPWLLLGPHHDVLRTENDVVTLSMAAVLQGDEMSYSVYISFKKCEHCQKEGEIVEVGNMTSNVSAMWDMAMPDMNLRDMDGKQCILCLDHLWAGVAWMKEHLGECRAVEPKNGWGSYEGALEFLESLRAAAEAHPDGYIRVSR
jgi:hypothetical protein